MPTRDLSYPGSSSSKYAQGHLQHATLQLLASAGFSRCSSQATAMLAEVLQRYLALVASTAGQYASHSGRVEGNAFDIRTALYDLGTDLEDVYAWIVDGDGRNVAGVSSSSSLSSSSFASASSSTIPPQDDAAAASEGPSILSAKDLGERLTRGKLSKSSKPRARIRYQAISTEKIQDELSLQVQEADEMGGGSAVDDAAERSEEHRGVNGTVKEEEEMDVDVEGPGDRDTEYQQRRDEELPYLPDFLPNIPQTRGPEENGQILEEDFVKMDGEFARARMERQKAADEKRQEETRTAAELSQQQASRSTVTADLKTAEEEARQREAAEFEALAGPPKPRRVLRDPWRSSVAFSDSTLASQQSIDDVPAIDDGPMEMDDFVPSTEENLGPKSSLRAFANDYRTLVMEAHNSTGSNLLTQPGPNYVRQSSKRRTIASTMADPGKFAPTDTLFASVPCRPSAIPFNPGPSLMITPPTATNPAPTFTSTHPHGRPAALIPSSGALVPSLRYRHADRTANAARLVGDGEVLRRVTRWTDPPPVLDEQHAERVFHGAPASKDLLHERHSFLRAALDTLLVKQQADRQRNAAAQAAAAAAAAAAEAGDEAAAKAAADAAAAAIEAANVTSSTSPDALLMLSKSEKKGPKSATLVHTWDWLPRDPLDATLPAKRLKGMQGVYLRGPNAQLGQSQGQGQTPTSAVATPGGGERERSVSFSLPTHPNATQPQPSM